MKCVLFELARRSLVAFFAVALVLGPSATDGHQALRVAEDAREIRAFRLQEIHLAKLRQVAQTLGRGFQPTPERPRADAAIFVVLSMSLAFNEPFADRTVTDMVRTIESGHADLHTAINSAGWTAAEYVRTQITLLLTFPVVASEKSGRAKVPTTDTAPENVAFVRRHWSEVESILHDLSAAAGQPKP